MVGIELLPLDVPGMFTFTPTQRPWTAAAVAGLLALIQVLTARRLNGLAPGWGWPGLARRGDCAWLAVAVVTLNTSGWD